jgi:transposase InsO family protein
MTEIPLTKEQEQFLHKLYYDEGNPLGIRKFYYLAETKAQEASVQHVTYRQITSWLKKQPSYQTNQPTRQTKHIRPIAAKTHHEMLQMDLMDFSQNTSPNAFKYVVVIIDVYSRFAWLYAAIDKKADTILNIFSSFYEDEIASTNVHVKKLITDQGAEFNTLNTFLLQYKIKHITSTNPQSQSIVERCNQTIRRLWDKYILLKNVKNRWSVLPKIAEMYNNTYHSSIKTTPQLLYNEENSDKLKRANNIQKERIENAVSKRVVAISNSSLPLVVGDYVRVKRLKKGNLRKDKGFSNWSPQIFVVVKRIRSKTEITQERYKIKSLDTDVEVKRTYYREDLLLIPKDTNLKVQVAERKEEEDFAPREKREIKKPKKYND